MLGKQSNQDSKSWRSLTRRAFLPWLIAGVSGLGFVSVQAFRRSRFSQPPPKFRKRPYFRKWKKLRPAPQLAPGFYLNPKSQIIHYVPEGKKPHFTAGINASRLQPADSIEAAVQSLKPNALTTDGSRAKVFVPARPPRVNKHRSSYSFERAAVSELKQNNVDRACDLLLYAIQYDQLIGTPSPSFRLYDLLAGVAVRFNKSDCLQRLAAVIAKTSNPVAVKKLADRQKKWQDPQSHWHLRWSNRSKQIEWKVDKSIGPGLLM